MVQHADAEGMTSQPLQMRAERKRFRHCIPCEHYTFRSHRDSRRACSFCRACVKLSLRSDVLMLLVSLWSDAASWLTGMFRWPGGTSTGGEGMT